MTFTQWLNWFTALLSSALTFLSDMKLFGQVPLGWFLVSCFVVALLFRVLLIKP